MANVTKISPNGTPYLITNLWDEIAYQLIVVKESIFGSAKGLIDDTISAVIDPVSKGVAKIGKGFTSFIPILLVVGAGALAVYILIIRKK